MKQTTHIPVLLEETREMLHLEKGMTVVDATLGGGGHTAMLLSAVAPGRVIAIETDSEAIARFGERVATDPVFEQATREGRLIVVKRNYSELKAVCQELGITTVDAILADLGYSSDQIETPDRGLSFREDGPLDMRLSQDTPLTARTVVNTYEEDDIATILREYGGESEARRIAQAIVRERAVKPIETTHALATLVTEAYPKKKRATMKIHPATQTFQALRIAVNSEFAHLETFLADAIECLAPGGRLAVIAFHSGEDIRVKQAYREAEGECICPPNFPVCQCGQVPKARIITKKPIVAGEKEVAENPRARSAKLRVLEKI